MAQIVELLVSRVHRFVGRPADGPAPEPADELVSEVSLRAGLGIVGDRYFGHQAHADACVTLIAAESLPPGVGLRQVRRNILLRGLPVDDLVGPARRAADNQSPLPDPEADDLAGAARPAGAVLVLDSGAGPVRLRVARPANPCAWMDVMVGPGAMTALRGHGGVRCVPLDDGVLRVGPVSVTVL
jgi:hypothetical protein